MLRVAVISSWLAVMILIWTQAVNAQQSDDVQQQIKQLKQQYEQEIADLQKRLAALEGNAAEQKTKPTSGEKYTVTAQQAAQEIVKPIEGNREPE